MFSAGSGVEREFRGLAEPLAWPFMLVVLVGVSCLAASAACLRVRTLGEPFIVGSVLAVRPWNRFVYSSIHSLRIRGGCSEMPDQLSNQCSNGAADKLGDCCRLL